MKIKHLLFAFTLLSAPAYAQLVDSISFVIDQDLAPIEAGLQDGEFFIKLERAQTLNFSFVGFGQNASGLQLEITNALDSSRALFSQKVVPLNDRSQLELKIADLTLPADATEENYRLSLVGTQERQLLFRFKLKP